MGRLRDLGARPQPDDVKHWEGVEDATELLRERRHGEALLLLRDVLRAQPRNPYAFHFLGVTLFEAHQLDPARDAFRAAIRLAPSYLGARVALSNVLRVLGDAKGALAEAREALRRFPKDPEAERAAGLAESASRRGVTPTGDEDGVSGDARETEARTEVRRILEMLGLGDDDEGGRSSSE
jgi:predicted Zn-dependent protease